MGSLATAFMIPVALSLGGPLPHRRSPRFMRAAGLTAMALLTIGGPLLVLEVLAFEVATSIAMAAWIILSLWLLLVHRWLRLSDALPVRVARFGEFLGAGVLAGYAVVGLGLLLPWMWWAQLVVFGVGVLMGLPSWLVSRCGSCSWPTPCVFPIMPAETTLRSRSAVAQVTLGRRSCGRVVL